MTVDTLETPVTQDLVWSKVRQRALITVAVPLAILTYLIYTWFAFGVPELLSRAQPERAVILAT